MTDPTRRSGFFDRFDAGPDEFEEFGAVAFFEGRAVEIVGVELFGEEGF